MSDLEKNLMTVKPVIDILKINTDTDNLEGVRSAQDYYIKLAQLMGFETNLCAEDKNGNKRVVEIRPSNPENKISKLGIVVHLDTVPIGERMDT